MTSDAQVCLACNRVHGGDYEPMHPAKYPDGDSRPRHEPSEPPVGISRFPFDPVVRQALINKGVLTPEDLVEAEKHIRAVSALFSEEMKT